MKQAGIQTKTKFQKDMCKYTSDDKFQALTMSHIHNNIQSYYRKFLVLTTILRPSFVMTDITSAHERKQCNILET